MNQAYLDTVRLLLDVAPAVFLSPRFAMKGGTALNLFVQDLPRLSVDIDVVFTDHALGREEALAAIAKDLAGAKAEIQKMGYRADVKSMRTGDEVKMFVTDGVSEVKVEVNYVFRGTILPTVRAPLTPATQELFAMNVTLPMLSTAELYGSKLVAALDRQHPRDMYDVQQMLDRFGLEPSFVDCFVAYLAGHSRPVHEVLFPRAQPLGRAFDSEFQGMTREPVTLESLIATQAELIDRIPRALTQAHRDFLSSLVTLEPAWDLMPFAHLQELPAIRWKLLNLEKLKSASSKRFATQFQELSSKLEAVPISLSGGNASTPVSR